MNKTTQVSPLSPNDQRSDALNPNNRAYKAAQDNRSRQLNPRDPAWHSSRGRAAGKGRTTR
jgi:hypothetical protein